MHKLTDEDREYYYFWGLLFESLQEILMTIKFNQEGESEVELGIQETLKSIYRKLGE
jgi:hypothetical protein